MVYMKNALDVGQWWSSSYEMDSQWSLTPLNGFETEGTFITRYNFDLPNLSKYSHVVIRLYYQDGIALWVNDMQITYDHVEYMHIHLSRTVVEADRSPCGIPPRVSTTPTSGRSSVCPLRCM